MPPSSLHIGVDLDEVCYPFVDTVRQYLIDVRGLDPLDLVAPTRWGLPLQQWGFTEATFEALFIEAIRSGHLFRVGTPISGAVEGLGALVADGHHVHLVTARQWDPVQEEIEQATRDWLTEHGLRHTSLIFDADKTCVPTDVFLDDAVHNYEALERAGGHPVLYHQPYNADHHGRRVRSWPEFLTLVEALAAQRRAATALR